MKLRNKKTGEIVERSSIVTLKYKISSCSSSLVEAEEYSSIRQLNEDWEDYKPAEPLIKDEKIRKAVKAWAEANDIKQVIVERDFSTYTFYPTDNTKVSITVWTDPILSNLLKDKSYTITELCGEDKPRPVIVNDIKYSSYEDYLESRKKKK